MRLVLVASALLVATAVHAQAQSASALLGCQKVVDDKLRLLCFDAAIKASDTSAEASTASTKEVISTAVPKADPTPESFKVVDSDDLYVAPGKYEGRPIELRRMRCFHADKNEYRCIAGGPLTLTLFTPEIRPSGEQEAIENDCGEVKKMMTSPKCLKTIRLVPAKHSEDLVNGYQKRVIIMSRYLEVVPTATSRKR